MEYLNVSTMEKVTGLQPVTPTAAVEESAAPSTQEQEYTMNQDNNMSIPENVILETRFYGLFQFDPLNRAIRQDKLDRLYDAVQAKNLLHLFPIVVTRQFIVVDGQHRLRVAEALNVPIYYIVSSQMKIEDAARVNVNTTGWRPQDYLDHYVKMGLADYIVFKEFWASHPFLQLSTAMRVLSIGADNWHDHGINTVFNDGLFRIGNITFANKVCGVARDFSQWVPFWRDSKFILALMALVDNPAYDHKRMMQKMEYLSTRLVKCADVASYLKLFQELYNHKTIESNHVNFLMPRRISKKERVSRKKSTK